MMVKKDDARGTLHRVPLPRPGASASASAVSSNKRSVSCCIPCPHGRTEAKGPCSFQRLKDQRRG